MYFYRWCPTCLYLHCHLFTHVQGSLLYIFCFGLQHPSFQNYSNFIQIISPFLYKRVLVEETEALHSQSATLFLELHNCVLLPNCWWLFICLQGCQCCDNTPPSWGKGGFSCHGYWLCTHRSQYSSESLFSSPHTQYHRLPIKHQSACGQSGDLFMCQPSRQLADTPVWCSLFTPSAIHSTRQQYKISIEPGMRQQNTLLAHYVAASSRCGGVTSSWLCVGDIRCEARGCCQWSIPPPALPSWGLWLQTAQQKNVCSSRKQKTRRVSVFNDNPLYSLSFKCMFGCDFYKYLHQANFFFYQISKMFAWNMNKLKL